MTKSLKHLKNK